MASHFTSEKPFPVISSKTTSLPLTIPSEEQKARSNPPFQQHQETASPASPEVPALPGASPFMFCHFGCHCFGDLVFNTNILV